jgi:hypothetical protein
MSDELAITIYLVGWIIISIMTAIWAGFSNRDTFDKICLSTIVILTASLWPPILPLLIIYGAARLVKIAAANKDI